jgi:hypothetical protein
MSIADRYRDLISATHRHGLTIGAKLRLDDIPEERQFPVVFSFTTGANAAAKEHGSLLFLFVPGESMLTSDILAEIIRRIQNCAAGCEHVLLFTEDDLRLVRRTLEASGLLNYATPFAYTYRAGYFSCEWQLASTCAQAVEVDPAPQPRAI